MNKQTILASDINHNKRNGSYFPLVKAGEALFAVCDSGTIEAFLKLMCLVCVDGRDTHYHPNMRKLYDRKLYDTMLYSTREIYPRSFRRRGEESLLDREECDENYLIVDFPYGNLEEIIEHVTISDDGGECTYIYDLSGRMDYFSSPVDEIHKIEIAAYKSNSLSIFCLPSGENTLVDKYLSDVSCHRTCYVKHITEENFSCYSVTYGLKESPYTFIFNEIDNTINVPPKLSRMISAKELCEKLMKPNEFIMQGRLANILFGAYGGEYKEHAIQERIDDLLESGFLIRKRGYRGRWMVALNRENSLK